MSIVSNIAERSEQKRAIVKTIYEALVAEVSHALKQDRKVRLPELGIISVKFRPAKPKRKGINPFTKKEQVFKAKPASNKLRFRPAKSLRQFSDKLPVVAPKKKHHK